MFGQWLTAGRTKPGDHVEHAGWEDRLGDPRHFDTGQGGLLGGFDHDTVSGSLGGRRMIPELGTQQAMLTLRGSAEVSDSRWLGIVSRKATKRKGRNGNAQ